MRQNEWAIRHVQAMQNPKPGYERAIVGLYQAIAAYYKSTGNEADVLNSDYILGPAAQDIVQGIRTLLNGETGRLDCGTLDSALCEFLPLDKR